MSTITGQKAVAINGAIKLDSKGSQAQTSSQAHKPMKLVQIPMEGVSDVEFVEDQSSELFCVSQVYFYFKSVAAT